MTLRVVIPPTVLITGVLLAVPAPASAAPVVEATDARADVRIFERNQGLSTRARKSIDIRALRVAEKGRRIRFTVGIKRIIVKPTFDQMFFVSLTPQRGADEHWHGEVAFTSKGKYGYAYLSDEAKGDVTWCDISKVSLRRAKAKVSVNVPRRCLPGQPAKVKLTSYTGHFRSDAPVWSRDKLRVPGRHDLTP